MGMTKTKSPKELSESDLCGICRNRGLRICPTSQHGTRANEYGDCFYCDSETPANVTCECQDD
jgi:hypothetical protein